MDTDVIAVRLQKLDLYLQGLHELDELKLAEYLGDERLQAYVERRLQLAIQVCIDIASYLIGQLPLPAPDAQDNVFIILGRHGIITGELARSMSGMVKLRNILVHAYLEIDDNIVYHNLTEELDDFEQFAQQIVQRFM
jgi:uncharacterized protein YutE (UPF0331/DUF86 family)